MMMHQSKHRAFVVISIVIALIIAILGLMPQQNAQMYAAYATHFFVGLVPVLGAAALLKYITCCHKKCKCDGNCKCCDNGSCSTEK